MPTAFQSLLRMPGRVSAVAGVTFTQLVRMRLFLVLAVFGIGFLGLQFIPYQDHLGVEFRGVNQLQLIKDVAMGCMQLFGLVFCVGATALLIPRDAEDRILYTILCKPVPRFDYLLGKALGVLGLLLVMLLLMDVLMSSLLHIRVERLSTEVHQILLENNYTEDQIAIILEQVREAGNTAETQYGIVAMFFGFSVLTTFTLLISCFTSGTIVSMVFGLGGYFVGMFQGQFLKNIIHIGGESGAGPVMQSVSEVVTVLIPDFGMFSVADAASAGEPFAPGLLGGLALVALCYMLLHLLVSTWIFSRKEF